MNRYAFGTSEGVWRLTAKEGRGACAVNKEGPIKAKPPLCPFFLLFGYQLARFTVSRPQTDLSLLASLPACPDLCSRLIVLAQFPTHDLSLSLPAHRKDYHTRNTCLRVYTPRFSPPPTIMHPTFSFSFPRCSLLISFFFLPLLSFLFANRHRRIFFARLDRAKESEFYSLFE